LIYVERKHVLYCEQGRNKRGAREAQSPGSRITLGRQIAAGAPNDCGGTEKSQRCHKCVLMVHKVHSTVHLLAKGLRFEHLRQT